MYFLLPPPKSKRHASRDKEIISIRQQLNEAMKEIQERFRNEERFLEQISFLKNEISELQRQNERLVKLGLGDNGENHNPNFEVFLI